MLGGGSDFSGGCDVDILRGRAVSRMLSVCVCAPFEAIWSFFSSEGTYRIAWEFFPTPPCPIWRSRRGGPPGVPANLGSGSCTPRGRPPCPFRWLAGVSGGVLWVCPSVRGSAVRWRAVWSPGGSVVSAPAASVFSPAPVAGASSRRSMRAATYPAHAADAVAHRMITPLLRGCVLFACRLAGFLRRFTCNEGGGMTHSRAGSAGRIQDPEN